MIFLFRPFIKYLCVLLVLLTSLLVAPAHVHRLATPVASAASKANVQQQASIQAGNISIAKGLKYVASIGGSNTTIAVTGTTALLGEGNGITVLDMSSWGSPALVTRLALPAQAQHIELAGHLGYVAYGEGEFGIGGLQILDLSNTLTPTVKADYRINNAVVDVQIAAGLAYLAVGGCKYGACFNIPGSLQIVDVSNPTRPSLRGSYTFDVNSRSLHVVGDRAYLGYSYCAHFYYTYVSCSYGGIMLIDIANPAAPALLSKYELNAPGYAVDVAGNIAYVAAGSNGLMTVDVSKPTSPALLATLGFSIVGEAHDVQINANQIYIANSDIYTGGLRILDIGTGATPILQSKADSLPQTIALRVMNNIVYLVGREAGVQLVDVTTSANPRVFGKYATIGDVSAIQRIDRQLYLSGGVGSHNILSIVNVADPKQPHLTGKYNSSTEIGFISMQVAGNYIYGISDQGHIINKILIIDISNPITPTLRTIYPRSGYDIAVTKERAYLTNGALDIVDVSNPDHPVLRASYPLTDSGSSFRQIQIVGDQAYITDQYKELQILDIAVPDSPRLLSSYNVRDYEALRYIAVASNFVYGAYDRNNDPDLAIQGIEVIDSTNPLSPTLRSQYNGLLGPVKTMKVVDNRLYITTDNFTSSSIMILDISDPDALRPIATLQLPADLEDIEVDGDLLYVSSGNRGVQIFQMIDLPFNAWLPLAQFTSL